MKLICEAKRSSVYYDKENDYYLKKFSPKFSKKIKYFFRLRKYPGDNFFYISNLLNSLGIDTPTIINHTKYSVITKRIDGISLEKYIELYPDQENIMLEKFSNLIIKLFSNNIYSGDLSLDNFIVSDDKIYALDLEDYRCEKFQSKGIKDGIKRLEAKVPNKVFNNVSQHFE